jgi:hypothetical protein
MGLLARVLRLSEPTHGRPPIPLYRVQETWYPWYQTSSSRMKAHASVAMEEQSHI